MASAVEPVSSCCVGEGGSADKLNITHVARSMLAASPLKSCPQMKPSDAIKGKTDEIRKIIESYGFVAPRIFGSTARGENEEGK